MIFFLFLFFFWANKIIKKWPTYFKRKEEKNLYNRSFAYFIVEKVKLLKVDRKTTAISEQKTKRNLIMVYGYINFSAIFSSFLSPSSSFFIQISSYFPSTKLFLIFYYLSTPLPKRKSFLLLFFVSISFHFSFFLINYCFFFTKFSIIFPVLSFFSLIFCPSDATHCFS